MCQWAFLPHKTPSPPVLQPLAQDTNKQTHKSWKRDKPNSLLVELTRTYTQSLSGVEEVSSAAAFGTKAITITEVLSAGLSAQHN